MAVVETVKIISKNKDGYIVINESDFTNRHKIYKELKPEVKAEVKETKEEEIGTKTSSKRGKREAK